MFKKIILCAFLILLPFTARAQQALNNNNANVGIRVTFASEAITVAGTSTGFTSATINPTCASCIPGLSKASMATCTLETAQIRVWSTGTAPTSSVGMLIDAGTTFVVFGVNDVANFRAIRTGSTSGLLNCQYSRIP